VADPGRLLAFATKGAGSNEEARIVELLAEHDVDLYRFEREHKASNVLRIFRHAARTRPELLVMEGTGTAGGLALVLIRGLLGIPFVFSSGDAVGPFLAGEHRRLKLPAWIYEWFLCRSCAGFIGWTPYLVGRALTLGAPRGVSAAGFTLHPEFSINPREVRNKLGVRQDALVFGIVGALHWNNRHRYCYGLELVLAVRRTARDDVAVVIVGDGDGLPHLRELAGEDVDRRVFLPGPIPHRDVASYLAAMDVGSLPQSVDQVGALRYTTKITEYVTARLPIVTGRLPMAYDMIDQWCWRLPGPAPWSEEYVRALADLIEHMTAEDILERRKAIPETLPAFDRGEQQRQVGAFIADLLQDLRSQS
jgi:glycosyltransferase involved in cell wall biosynthesis